MLRLPKALPHQIPVLLHPARNKVVVCGRRWGKSALGLQATIRGHGPHRGARKGALSGGKIWWVAPDYPTASEMWRDLKRACRSVWSHKDEVERRIELPTGGSVSVKSAHDPESLVAVGLDGVVIDEAAKVKPEAWYGSLRATLADRGGWAIFISTPKGYNWFHDLFAAAETSPDWARWQRPTSDNPLIPASELEAAKRDSPRYFGQEFGAQFQSLEGAEWPPEYFPPSIWFDSWPEEYVLRGIALDPSKGRNARKPREGRPPDFSAYILGQLDLGGTLWVDADLDNVRDATQIVRDGLQHQRSFNPGAFAVEINAFQELLGTEFFRQAKEANIFVPLYGIINSESKEVRIRTLGPLLAQGRVRVKNTRGGRLLVQQLRDFPAGEYDDGPDALEMCARLLVMLRTGQHTGRGKPQLLRG